METIHHLHIMKNKIKDFFIIIITTILFYITTVLFYIFKFINLIQNNNYRKL